MQMFIKFTFSVLMATCFAACSTTGKKQQQQNSNNFKNPSSLFGYPYSNDEDMVRKAFGG